MASFLIISLCAAYYLITTTAQSPPEILDKVVQKLWSSDSATCSMYSYNYGGGIIFDSMYRATEQFSSNKNNFNTSIILDYNSLLSPVLNDYLYSDKTTPGYRITHNQTISFESPQENAIGDVVGLFPISYIDQLFYMYNKTGDESIFNFTDKYQTEWKLIFTTSDHYILQFPRRLTDEYGTISRYTSGKWKHEPNINASFVWADDNFMALTLLTRLIKILHYCHKYINNNCHGVDVQNNITTYIQFVYNQHIGFSEHLMYSDPHNNGLYAHGYNFASGDHSCCPWGRANAWIMASHIEAIKMYKYLNDSKYVEQYNELVALYANQVNQVAKLQDNSTGQWHQIINDTTTFFEASCSSVFLNSIIDGKLMDILPINKYPISEWNDMMELGWNGLLKFIDLQSGIILNACCATGIQNDVKEYEDRSTAYCRIGNPGDAAFIINALISYQQYLNAMN